MRKSYVVAAAVVPALVGATLMTINHEAGATARPALSPRYDTASIEPEDPTYQFRAMPALQHVGWNDKGVRRNRFIRSFLISPDGAKTPPQRRIQYQDASGHWQPAIDAEAKPARHLMYSPKSGNHATVNNLFTARTGELVAIDLQTQRDKAGRFVYRRTSTDGGASWKSERATLDLAGAAIAPGALGQTFQRVIRLPDGSLVLPYYAYHKGKLGASHLLVSTNEGKAWRRAVTAFKSDQNNYTEATVTQLANKRLMMIARYDVIEGNKLYSKLSYRISTGEVRTAAALATVGWTGAKPVKVPGGDNPDVVRGVAPVLHTMAGGKLMLLFGRPRNKITFSDNNGATWATAHNLYDNLPKKCDIGPSNGAKPPVYFPCSDLGSSGYMGVAVTTPQSAYIMGDNCQSWGCAKDFEYAHPRDDRMWRTLVRLQ